VHCSRKNPCPLHGRSLEIPRGRGVLKAKILEAKYEAKLKFLVGRRVQNKKSSLGEVWTLSELHIDNRPSCGLNKNRVLEASVNQELASDW